MSYWLIILLLKLPFSLFSQNSNESVVCGLILSDKNLNINEIAVYEYYTEPQIDQEISNYLKKKYNINYTKNNVDFNKNRISKTLCLNSVKFLTEKEMHLYNTKAKVINKSVENDFSLTNATEIVWYELGLTYCEFSLPIYSQDGNYVAIEYCLTRGGMLDYWKVWLIMEKKENKWVKSEAYQIEQS